jgi:hypothetical protein
LAFTVAVVGFQGLYLLAHSRIQKLGTLGRQTIKAWLKLKYKVQDKTFYQNSHHVILKSGVTKNLIVTPRFFASLRMTATGIVNRLKSPLPQQRGRYAQELTTAPKPAPGAKQRGHRPNEG